MKTRHLNLVGNDATLDWSGFRNMFKRFFAVALLALVPAFSWASYAFVSSAQNTANGNTVTVAPTAGNYLVVVSVTSAGAGAPTATIADNQGSTWQTKKTTVQDGTTTNFFYTVFVLPVAGSGITTLTITYAGGTPGSTFIAMEEFSGLSATGFQGISTFSEQVTPGTGANLITSNSFSVTTQPAALIGWTVNINQNGGSTAGTSPIAFTRRVNGTAIMLEDARVTATGNAITNATNTTRGTADTFMSYVIAISEGSVAGAPFTPLTIGLGTTPNDGTGDPARTAFTKVNTMTAQLFGVPSIQTPTTGFTITPAQGVTQLVLNPAGTLATGTLIMPANPGDQQPLEVMTSQTITALTNNPNSGQSLNGPLTTLAANTSAKWIWEASLSTWFRQR